MKFYINETANMGYSPYDILLDDTNELNSIADRIQKAKGYLPLFDDSYEYDDENWYNFYLECDSDGVKGLWFEYGIDGAEGNRIELTEEDKANAFKAVCDFFGGLDEYKHYIDAYESRYEDAVEYQKGWETILQTLLRE